MRSTCLKAVLVALALALVPAASFAGDYTPIPLGKAPVVLPPEPAIVTGDGNAQMEYLPVDQNTIIIEEGSPTQPMPAVRYGCKRIWRCDSVVCDWRRGCWGTYGYMEGPYYTVELAKRQWERHGWSMSTPARQRVTISK